MIKINITLEDGLTHFCYVPEQYNLPLGDVTENIKAWAKKDYNIDLRTKGDLEILRYRIFDEYENKYPNIYNKKHPEKQGWLRVWYREHFRNER